MKVSVFGQMHNGKSTYAEILQKQLNKDNDFYIGAWAARIKSLVSVKYNVTLEYVNYWKNIPTPPPGFNVTMREVLQKEGESSRECKATVWIDHVMTEYRYINLIIDDGRYANEAGVIKADSGYNIVIIRPGMINDSPHPSECGIGGVVKAFMNKTDIPPEWGGLINEYVINNEGIEELKKVAFTTARNIFDKIKAGSTNKG